MNALKNSSHPVSTSFAFSAVKNSDPIPKPTMLHGYSRGADNLYRKSVEINGAVITIIRKPDGHLYRTEDAPAPSSILHPPSSPMSHAWVTKRRKQQRWNKL